MYASINWGAVQTISIESIFKVEFVVYVIGNHVEMYSKYLLPFSYVIYKNTDIYI